MKITPLKIESQKQAEGLMASLGVSPEGIRILSPKSVAFAFKIEGISSWEANIIKQHLLSLGTDSAINRDALTKKIKTATIIFGNLSQLKKLCIRLKEQPFKLREISRKLALCLENLSKERFIFKARGKTLRIKQPLICGIVNLTPDSFSGDGLFRQIQNSRQRRGSPKAAKFKVQSLVLKKVEQMLKDGAKIIDLGGESTRPFSKPVTEKEELRRVIPFLKSVRKEFRNILISVDTYKGKVVKAAAEEGADMINEITSLRGSSRTADLIRKYKLGCILMHMKGKPAKMQVNPKYGDVVGEIINFFDERLSFCERSGIAREQILIDPGIGFGKRCGDNFTILKRISEFKIFGLPIFLGVSRKSFIGKTLKLPVGQRLAGTLAANIVAILGGARVLRVHDVKETAQAIKIVSPILNTRWS